MFRLHQHQTNVGYNNNVNNNYFITIKAELRHKYNEKGLLSDNKVVILQCIIGDTYHIFQSAFSKQYKCYYNTIIMYKIKQWCSIEATTILHKQSTLQEWVGIYDQSQLRKC